MQGCDSKLSKNDSRNELTSAYLVERVDLRFYNDLIEDITTYQIDNYIPSRVAAIIELVRSGLVNQSPNADDPIVNDYGNNVDFKRIEVFYPSPLMDMIHEYKDKRNVSRPVAIKTLIRIGLKNPLTPF